MIHETQDDLSLRNTPREQLKDVDNVPRNITENYPRQRARKISFRTKVMYSSIIRYLS